MRITPMFLVALVATPCAARHAGAQARAFAFPDTLGANFSIADTATAHGAASDYDFLEGSWTFEFQQRKQDGTFNPSFSGQWVSRKKTGGLLVEDHWRPDNAGASSETGTYTYRMFNQTRNLWEMMGVNTSASGWAPGLTWSDAENRYAIQHTGPTIMRIRYFRIEQAQFLWRADMSADGGKTWIRDWWTMRVRRVGA